MSNKLKSMIIGSIALTIFAIGSAAMAQTVRDVVALRVTNPAVYLAAADQLYQSDPVAGIKVTLLAAPIDGSTPATHYVVYEFDDYAAWEAGRMRVQSSPEWTTYVNMIRGSAQYLGRTFQIERFADGGDWRQHDAMVIFNMTVSDPGTFLAAFSELVESADNPGSVGVAEIRAGGMGSTHLVGVSGESLAAVNESLDETFASEAFGTYASKISDIRTINNVSMFRRLRSYN